MESGFSYSLAFKMKWYSSFRENTKMRPMLMDCALDKACNFESFQQRAEPLQWQYSFRIQTEMELNASHEIMIPEIRETLNRYVPVIHWELK